MAHGLVVGSAVRDVTPAPGTPMAGFAARTRAATGAHDPLFARAVAFGDGRHRLLLVVLDVIGVDAALVAEVRAAIARVEAVDDVAVVATHTHGGPALLSEAFLGAVDATVRIQVIAGAVAAGIEALRAMAPAAVTWHVGREPTVARNRRDPNGPIDPRVPVVTAWRDGRPVTTIVGYACHPVTLGADNLRFTRDYPGFLVDALEARWPGTTALFVGGCAGQLNTGHTARASLDDAPAARRTYDEARRLGSRLADAAAAAVEVHEARALVGPLRAARRRVHLPYASPATNPADDLRRWRAELDTDPTPARRGWLEACCAWAERHPSPRSGSVPAEVGCWAIGDLALVWFPGEVFVEQALDLDAVDDGPLVCVGNANAAPGYIPHPSAFAAGGYEVDEAFRFYGAPGPFTPAASAALHSAARDLLRTVRRETAAR